MAYEIVLETFSGPLDLLLHLIQKQELNIHDIPIALVTEQYLAYLRTMEELSLEVASEFIVMAATLLYIKSRMLLPRPSRASEEAEGPEADPREELVQQLLEYQRCKWAAERLREREAQQSLIFRREPLDLRPYMPTEPPPLEGVSIWQLVDAYRRLLARMPKEDMVAEIPGHVISVDEAMEEMSRRLVRWRRCTFSQLLQGVRQRSELVSAFLALLELVKARRVRVWQASPFDEIEIEWNGEKQPC